MVRASMLVASKPHVCASSTSHALLRLGAAHIHSFDIFVVICELQVQFAFGGDFSCDQLVGPVL